MMEEVREIAVVGAGTMGQGIAHVAAAAGYDVRLHDTTPELIQRGLEMIRANLDRGVEKGKVVAADREATLLRIHTAADLEAAAESAGLIVEAVIESLAVKLELFARLDRIARPGAILASNTSALPIGQLAAATARADRVVGMHFFNPVHLMALVEIVRAEKTSDAVVEQVVSVSRRMGKEPIVVRDSPGFASSRLGLVLGLEAMRMLEQEVATAEDIDTAMVRGYGHPMGPLRLTDLVGLDVRLAIAEHLHRELGSDAFRPPEILRRLVAEGRVGKKVGRGFYTW